MDAGIDWAKGDTVYVMIEKVHDTEVLEKYLGQSDRSSIIYYHVDVPNIGKITSEVRFILPSSVVTVN